ncbi:MAG TPA: glycosyltransferase family 4 protein [Thermoanaerobaculia bacterium]|jgi:glycosyltransferase involved in cell wall biosynthesis|nr:glycosyltransferase family 4 protein [Thermoanaerobaculia bacterium]
MKRIRVLALASYPVEAASSRYRIVQFIGPLTARGIDVTFSPFLDASLFAALYEPGKLLPRLPRIAARILRRWGALFRASVADVVFVQREAMLFGPPFIEWLTTCLLRRPLVLDLDDATWVPYTSPVYGRLATFLKWSSKTDHLIRWAHVVICGSPNIETYVRSRSAAAVIIPTVVDVRRFRPGDAGARSIPTIGWIGSHGTFHYLERLFPIFERLGRELPFRLMIVGSGQAEVRVPGVEVEYRPFRMEREVVDFQSIDIGVYPIADDEWSAGKAGFKAVQYMATGIPFVMSPVGVCATMGSPGQTHFAAVSDGDWLDALRSLVADAQLRSRMAAACRAFAEQHYDIDEQADALAVVIRNAMNQRKESAIGTVAG